MDIETIKKLKKALPKKGLTKVAEKAGVSKALVTAVFNGSRDNNAVIDAAIQVVAEHKEEVKMRTKLAQKVLS